jgi:hypothetical protein
MEIVKTSHGLTGRFGLSRCLPDTDGRFSLISPSEKNKRTDWLIARLGTL